MHISFIATIVAVLVVISACKIQISVPKDGKVQSESGSFSCGSNQDCEIEVNDVFFDQTFVAMPNNGYEFEGWKREAFYLCGGSTESSSAKVHEFRLLCHRMGVIRLSGRTV